MSGFSTLNRWLGKKNKDKTSGGGSGNGKFSKSSTNLSISSTNLNEPSQLEYNRITPLPVATSNAPFEQTFRITVLLPKDQLYVCRLGARVPLSKLLELVCDNKLLDKQKYEFRNPVDPSQVYDCELTIGAVGLSEIRLCHKSESYDSFSPDEVIKLNRTNIIRESLSSSSDYSNSRLQNNNNNNNNNKSQTLKATPSPYSSSNSLNSMDSTGMNTRTPMITTATQALSQKSSMASMKVPSNGKIAPPPRKKRTAPRPPSQNAIPEKAILEMSNGNIEETLENLKNQQEQLLPKKDFYVSTPNLSATSPSDVVDCNGNVQAMNGMAQTPDTEEKTTITLYRGSVQDLSTTGAMKIPEPSPRKRLIQIKKKTNAPAPPPRNSLYRDTDDDEDLVSSTSTNPSLTGLPLTHRLPTKDEGSQGEKEMKEYPKPVPRQLSSTISSENLDVPLKDTSKLPLSSNVSKTLLNRTPTPEPRSLSTEPPELDLEEDDNVSKQADSGIGEPVPSPIPDSLPSEGSTHECKSAFESSSDDDEMIKVYNFKLGKTLKPKLEHKTLEDLNLLSTAGTSGQSTPTLVNQAQGTPSSTDTSSWNFTIPISPPPNFADSKSSSNFEKTSATEQDIAGDSPIQPKIMERPKLNFDAIQTDSLERKPKVLPKKEPATPAPSPCTPLNEIVEELSAIINENKMDSLIKQAKGSNQIESAKPNTLTNFSISTINEQHKVTTRTSVQTSVIETQLESNLKSNLVANQGSKLGATSELNETSNQGLSQATNQVSKQDLNQGAHHAVYQASNQQSNTTSNTVSNTVPNDVSNSVSNAVSSTVSNTVSNAVSIPDSNPDSKPVSTAGLSAVPATASSPDSTSSLNAVSKTVSPSVSNNVPAPDSTTASTPISDSTPLSAPVLSPISAPVSASVSASTASPVAHHPLPDTTSTSTSTSTSFHSKDYAEEDFRSSPRKANFLNLSSLQEQRKSLTRADSFQQTTNFSKQSSLDSSNGSLNSRSSSHMALNKIDSGNTLQASKRSSSELSIGESPSLQSLEIIKTILNSRKNSLTNKSLEVGLNRDREEAIQRTIQKAEESLRNKEKSKELGPSPPDSPSLSSTKEVPKTYRYSGPPSINFSTWNERPKVQVAIKNEGDYIFGGKKPNSLNQTMATTTTTMPRNYRMSMPAEGLESQKVFPSDSPILRMGIPLEKDYKVPISVRPLKDEEKVVEVEVEENLGSVLREKPPKPPKAYSNSTTEQSFSTLPRNLGSKRFSAQPSQNIPGPSLLRTTSVSKADSMEKKDQFLESETKNFVPFGQGTLRKTGLKEKILAKEQKENLGLQQQQQVSTATQTLKMTPKSQSLSPGAVVCLNSPPVSSKTFYLNSTGHGASSSPVSTESPVTPTKVSSLSWKTSSSTKDTFKQSSSPPSPPNTQVSTNGFISQVCLKPVSLPAKQQQQQQPAPNIDLVLSRPKVLGNITVTNNIQVPKTAPAAPPAPPPLFNLKPLKAVPKSAGATPTSPSEDPRDALLAAIRNFKRDHLKQV